MSAQPLTRSAAHTQDLQGCSMAMTIDEAIQHCEEKARELGCTECAQEHRQLAAWLRELKFRRQGAGELERKLAGKTKQS